MNRPVDLCLVILRYHLLPPIGQPPVTGAGQVLPPGAVPVSFPSVSSVQQSVQMSTCMTQTPYEEEEIRKKAPSQTKLVPALPQAQQHASPMPSSSAATPGTSSALPPHLTAVPSSGVMTSPHPGVVQETSGVPAVATPASTHTQPQATGNENRICYLLINLHFL